MWRRGGRIAHVANIDVARVLLENGANLDPTAFVELLLASGADRAIVNNVGRTAVDEALLQVGTPIGLKRLERAIALLG